MKRLILTMMAMCITGAAYAQQPDARSTAEGVVVAPAGSLAASAASAVQAVPPASGPRRRPSMVGYIDDSSISNKFRVRFDIGTDLEAPTARNSFMPSAAATRICRAPTPITIRTRRDRGRAFCRRRTSTDTTSSASTRSMADSPWSATCRSDR